MSSLVNSYRFATAGGISSPSEIPEIWDFWEPRLEGLADNDPIGQLTGQITPGTGHNWLQSNGSLKPIFKASILNGHGIARFDGTDDEMTSVDPTSLTSVHFITVIRMDSNTPAAGKSGTWSFGIVGNAYPMNSPNTDITADAFRTSAQQFSKSGIDVAQWRVLEIISTSSEWTFLLDGTQLHTTAGAFTHQSAGFIRLGREGPFGGNYLDGDLAAMYICSPKMTTSRGLLINYINSEFGLSSL